MGRAALRGNQVVRCTASKLRGNIPSEVAHVPLAINPEKPAVHSSHLSRCAPVSCAGGQAHATMSQVTGVLEYGYCGTAGVTAVAQDRSESV